jgi:hypothetical protein
MWPSVPSARARASAAPLRITTIAERFPRRVERHLETIGTFASTAATARSAPRPPRPPRPPRRPGRRPSRPPLRRGHLRRPWYRLSAWRRASSRATVYATTVAQAPSTRTARTAPIARTAARAPHGHRRPRHQRGRHGHRVHPNAAAVGPSTLYLCSITREVWCPSRPRYSSLRVTSSSN